MRYNDIPTIPQAVANIITKYQLTASMQGSNEASILFWILEDVRETEEYTETEQWIENNIADLAFAVQTGKYRVEKVMGDE